MRIYVTSGSWMPKWKMILKVNQHFLNKKSWFYSVIPIEESGFVLNVKNNKIEFSIYKNVNGQSEKITKFIEDTFKNKIINVQATEKCEWLEHINNVKILK